MIFVIVLTLYLLIEGRTAFEWQISLAPKKKRPRLRQTAMEMSEVVGGGSPFTVSVACHTNTGINDVDNVRLIATQVGQIVSVQVIPRPHEDLGAVLPLAGKKQAQTASVG